MADLCPYIWSCSRISKDKNIMRKNYSNDYNGQLTTRMIANYKGADPILEAHTWVGSREVINRGKTFPTNARGCGQLKEERSKSGHLVFATRVKERLDCVKNAEVRGVTV
jgi:hypothetical protein